MVNLATDRYRLSQNRIQQYIDSNIIKSRGEKVSKTSLNADFKMWFEINYKSGIKPKELYELLDKIGYECINNNYYGFTLREEQLNDPEVFTKEERFKNAFENHFEITGNKSDTIVAQEIEFWAMSLQLKIQKSKSINVRLLADFHLDTEDRNQYKQIKMSVPTSPDKKGRWCWVGIKRRPTPLNNPLVSTNSGTNNVEELGF